MIRGVVGVVETLKQKYWRKAIKFSQNYRASVPSALRGREGAAPQGEGDFYESLALRCSLLRVSKG